MRLLFVFLFSVFSGLGITSKMDVNSILSETMIATMSAAKANDGELINKLMKLPANQAHVSELLSTGYKVKINHGEVESEGRIVGEILFVSNDREKSQDFTAKVAIEKNSQSPAGWKITGFFIQK